MTTAVRAPGFAANLGAALRRRWAALIRRRQGIDHLPVTFRARRIYILPSRGGLAFGLLVFVMLLAGLNYANNMALLITFLIGGFTLIAMHLTHRNLSGIRVVSVATVDAFAGEHGRVLLTLESGGKFARYGIECQIAGGNHVDVLLPQDATARAEMSIELPRRGRIAVPRLKLATRFPFGLFYAWTYLHLEASLIAWPVPRGRREPPEESTTGGDAPSVLRAGDEEWAGLREFRSGDSPRHVAWAAYARGRGLLVKTYQAPAAHHRTFDFESIPDGVEERLEQLAAWVEAAHARGERYGLKLGGLEIPPGAGSEHRRRCLDALALYGLESGEAA